jgi:probable phosphoglycerate mutase
VANGTGTELWLIRHGETEWSAEGKHTSTTDVALTERGRERAVVLGKFLAATSFCAVMRSPMARARETCEIAGYGERAVVDNGLCEWDYGVYEGRTTAEIQREIPGWSVWTNEIVGGETLAQVGARADGVIARALAAARDCEPDANRVLLFGHAHILRILAARWIGLAPIGGSLLSLGTGSVSVLGWERETRVVKMWNRSFEQ